MASNVLIAVLAASTLSIVNPTQAAEEDAPRAVTQDKIEAVLQDAGFETWGDIKRAEGKWQVDDALHGDGHEYDVTIDGESYDILSRKRED